MKFLRHRRLKKIEKKKDKEKKSFLQKFREKPLVEKIKKGIFVVGLTGTLLTGMSEVKSNDDLKNRNKAKEVLIEESKSMKFSGISLDDVLEVVVDLIAIGGFGAVLFFITKGALFSTEELTKLIDKKKKEKEKSEENEK